MSTLKEVLADAAKKPTIVKDCCDLIDAEVGSKGGLGGMAIKAAYKAVQGIKPGFVSSVVDGLLPEFAEALEPIEAEAASKGVSVPDHFKAQSGRVADALLAVTDNRAQHTKYGVIRSTYGKLRGTAKKHVEAAIPRLAGLVARYT